MSISRRSFAGALAGAAAGGIGAGALTAAAKPGPTKAQAEWMKLGYGMFLHFGPNTFAGVNWGDGKFPASGFTPGKLDCAQWAGVAAEAGMKYAVLTTKHLDGFCLWPSKHTEYSVKAARAGDVVGQYAEAFRKAGLRVGFYYSLWDVNQPVYEDDARYAEYMRNQITELLTGYGPVVELWFDGAWDKDHPTKKWPWDAKWEQDPKSGLGHGERYEWKALYEHIHKLQPDCLVVNNSSSDRPGGVRYLPVDLRTAEHFDFVYEDKLYEPVTEPVYEGKTYLPLEYCTSLNPGWFWKPAVYYTHPSAETIASWHRQARKTSANLLLNVGPNRDGLIPEVNARYLRAAAKLTRRG
jgi:alpha-L-fucosidase